LSYKPGALMDFSDSMVQDCISGNADAIEALIEFYSDKILGLAFKFTFNLEDAEDLTQEILIKVINNLHSFKGKSKLSTWIYSIAFNHCVNFKNKKNKIEIENIDFNLDFIKADNHSYIPDNMTVKKELLQKIMTAANELPDNYRQILILFSFAKMPHKDISKMLKIPEGTLWSRLNKARELMREKLSGYLESGYIEEIHL